MIDAGQSEGIVPCGLEALDILRLEKGHVLVGIEIDGRTSAADLGFGGMGKKGDYIGKRSLARPARAGRPAIPASLVRPADQWQ